ncbi:MAG: UDP-N-acetylglucosamine 1-carboxyvinyltransferase [bacterium]
MRKIVCEGPASLKGEFIPQGSKNGALPLIAASIVFDNIIKITNVPNIEDIKTMINILEELGAKCTYEDNTLLIDSRGINGYEISWELASKMRASFDLLGALVYRFGKAIVPLPGGCLIGNRKIDMHLWITEKLGFKVNIDSGNVIITDFDPRKTEEEIKFWIPSVGATKNATFLGLFISNQTGKKITFQNVAVEPEITFLWEFLKQNGFNISYNLEKRILQTSPSKNLTNTIITVKNIVDRIEAGTFAIAACATKGNIKIQDLSEPPYDLKTMLSYLWETLKSIEVEIKFQKEFIEVQVKNKLKSFEIDTDVYPLFPTDLHPQMTSLATTIEGISIIRENLFDDRFVYTGELIRLGANINVINNKVAMVNGGKPLKGAPVKATDIRGGAAILIAALTADGKSTITNVYQIYRGYENITAKLSKLGAYIYEELFEESKSLNTNLAKVSNV